MKRSASYKPDRVQEYKRQLRLQREKEIEQAEANLQAKKKRAREEAAKTRAQEAQREQQQQQQREKSSARARPPRPSTARQTKTNIAEKTFKQVQSSPGLFATDQQSTRKSFNKRSLDPPTSIIANKQFASPASSVSFSQHSSSHKKSLSSPAVPSSLHKTDSSDEDEPETRRPRRRKRQLVLSSSSSDSEECRRRRRSKPQKAQKPALTSKPQQRTRTLQDSSDEEPDRKPSPVQTDKPKINNKENSSDSSRQDQKSLAQAAEPVNAKTSQSKQQHEDSSDDSDALPTSSSVVRRAQPSPATTARARRTRRYSSSSSDSDSPILARRKTRVQQNNIHNDDQTAPADHGGGHKPAHNPLARARVMEEPIQFSTPSKTSGQEQQREDDNSNSTKHHEDNSDTARSHDSKARQNPDKGLLGGHTPPAKNERWSKSSDSNDGSRMARNPLTRSFVKVPAVDSLPKKTDALWSDSSAEEKDEKKKESPAKKIKKKPIVDLEYGTVREGLMPEFDYPLFGPWELEPLVLQVPDSLSDDEDDQYNSKDEDEKLEWVRHMTPIWQRCEAKQFQVPASVARYLGLYQKEGVQFLFRTIFKNGGGILGDDMGVGKTVQVIALLSALLEKKGSHEDKLELQRRRRLAAEWRASEDLARDQCLQQGLVYTEKKAIIPEYLPVWAPILILAPSAILDNWVGDSKTWGYFQMSNYYSADQYGGVMDIRTGASEILLVSHKLFEMESHFETLNEIPWKLVIVDEHHKLKSIKAKATKNLKKLRDDHKVPVLGLTGTVMQNNHEELHCLIDLAAKGLIGDWPRFKEHFGRPIKMARAKDASQAVIDLGIGRSKEFSRLLFKAYLRRTKEEVLQNELPEKNERIVFCELSDLQKRIYQHMIDQPDFKLLRYSSDPCDCGVNKPFFKMLKKLRTKDEKLAFLRENRKKILKRAECCYKTPIISLDDQRIDPGAVIWKSMHENDVPCDEEKRIRCPYCILFAAMSRLMKVCSHVALIQPEINPDAATSIVQRDKAEKDFAYAKAFIPDDCLEKLPGQSYIRSSSMMDNHFNLSGKMKTLDRLLKRIADRAGRVLLFSASTQTLDLIENYMKSEGKSYLRMDGGTSRERRKELADEFKENNGIFVFLLSTRAMGLGLNLTAANTVIIFDVEWNPSNDSQAQDRAYRLGQTANVVVFRLVSRGTIEELKYLRQVYKTQLKNETIVDVQEERREVAARLFRGVDGDQSRRGELFGIANLLRFKDGTFMPYGEETRDSHRYGGDVYDVQALVDAAQEAGEDAIEKLVGEDEGVQDLVGLTENEFPEAGVSKEEMLGAQSQNMFDLYDVPGQGGEGTEGSDDDDSTVVGEQFQIPAITDAIKSGHKAVQAPKSESGGKAQLEAVVDQTAVPGLETGKCSPVINGEVTETQGDAVPKPQNVIGESRFSSIASLGDALSAFNAKTGQIRNNVGSIKGDVSSACSSEMQTPTKLEQQPQNANSSRPSCRSSSGSSKVGKDQERLAPRGSACDNKRTRSKNELASTLLSTADVKHNRADAISSPHVQPSSAAQQSPKRNGKSLSVGGLTLPVGAVIKKKKRKK